MGSRCVRLRAALRAPGLRCAGLFQAMRWGGETEARRNEGNIIARPHTGAPPFGERGPNINCERPARSAASRQPRGRSPVVDEGVQVVEAAEQRVGHPAALRGAGATAVEVSKSGDQVIRGNPASK